MSFVRLAVGWVPAATAHRYLYHRRVCCCMHRCYCGAARCVYHSCDRALLPRLPKCPDALDSLLRWQAVVLAPRQSTIALAIHRNLCWYSVHLCAASSAPYDALTIRHPCHRCHRCPCNRGIGYRADMWTPCTRCSRCFGSTRTILADESVNNGNQINCLKSHECILIIQCTCNEVITSASLGKSLTSSTRFRIIVFENTWSNLAAVGKNWRPNCMSRYTFGWRISVIG